MSGGLAVASEVRKEEYLRLLTEAVRLGHVVGDTSLGLGLKTTGKVRDVYEFGNGLMGLVATDRVSAFDRNLALVPCKGHVLTQTSLWWFSQVSDIVPHHVVSSPHPNVVLCRKASVFPIEFVVRGYMTGSTSTSLWTHYARGEREYCGCVFPDGLKKNAKLDAPVLTPTTKEAEHDRPISPKDIVKEGWMTQEDLDKATSIALKLFQRGQEIAKKHGLLLVDTKYEMGVIIEEEKEEGGSGGGGEGGGGGSGEVVVAEPSSSTPSSSSSTSPSSSSSSSGSSGRRVIVLVDEIHTPDSSRYWLADSYEERFARGEEPENIDKEFLRLWYRERCDPYNDTILPTPPPELLAELSRRYIQLYERITASPFPISTALTPDSLSPSTLSTTISTSLSTPPSPHSTLLLCQSHSILSSLKPRFQHTLSATMAGECRVSPTSVAVLDAARDVKERLGREGGVGVERVVVGGDDAFLKSVQEAMPEGVKVEEIEAFLTSETETEA